MGHCLARMRALVALLAVAALLAGCSRTPTTTGAPGIAERTRIVPEERSTCEAVARVDLAVVDDDPTSLERAARALDVAGARAPADVRPVLGSLAASYRAAAEAPGRAPLLPTERAATDIVGWFNAHCGGAR